MKKNLLVVFFLALIMVFNPLNNQTEESYSSSPKQVLMPETSSEKNQNIFEFIMEDQTSVSIHLDVLEGKIRGVKAVEIIKGEDKTNIPCKYQKEFELDAGSKPYDFYTLSTPSIKLDTYRYSVDFYTYTIEDTGEKIAVRLNTHLEDAQGQAFFNEKYLDFTIVL
jgi:hypothetical protein